MLKNISIRYNNSKLKKKIYIYLIKKEIIIK